MNQLSGVFESDTSDNGVEMSSGLEPGDDPLSAQLTNEPGALLFPSAVPLEGFPTIRMEEVFRFDVTKEWVYGRWPRKSTALAHADLFGVRVPLVTGTNIDDVAGALTDCSCNLPMFRASRCTNVSGMVACKANCGPAPRRYCGPVPRTRVSKWTCDWSGRVRIDS